MNRKGGTGSRLRKPRVHIYSSRAIHELEFWHTGCVMVMQDTLPLLGNLSKQRVGCHVWRDLVSSFASKLDSVNYKKAEGTGVDVL